MSTHHDRPRKTAHLMLPLLLLAGCGLADPNTRYPVSPRIAKQAQNIYSTPNETKGSIVDAVPRVEQKLGTGPKRDPGGPRIAWRLYGDTAAGQAKVEPTAVAPQAGLFGPRTGKLDPRLWRAALDAVALMPLTMSDPEKGVILTDWCALPELPNQRVKIAIYLVGPGISPQSLRVAIQRQEKDATGRWVDRPAAPGSILELERRILHRAAALAAENSPAS